MSFYRNLMAAVAAMGLATAAFAADETANPTQSQNPSDNTTQAVQVADQTTATTGTEGTDAQGTKVNINTATIKELTKVKGLNANRAKAIVSFRKKNGNFTSVDDLKKITAFKKLSDDQLKKIQDQLTTG